MKKGMLGLWLVLAGCSAEPPRGEVEGVLRRKGNPIPNALVVFVPDADKGTAGARASGKTDEQGRFRLREQDRDGVVAGWHRVIIEDLAIYSAPRGPDGTVLPLPPPRFAKRYGDPLQTPLRKEVKPGAQVIDVHLDDES